MHRFERHLFRVEVLLGSLAGGIWLMLGWGLGWRWGSTIAIAVSLIFSPIFFHVIRLRNESKARMWYVLRGQRPPDERTLAFQALAQSAAVLWFVEITSLAFVAAGGFMLVKQPEKWLLALPAIVFFGPSAALFAYMLLLRRRAATNRF